MEIAVTTVLQSFRTTMSSAFVMMTYHYIICCHGKYPNSNLRLLNETRPPPPPRLINKNLFFYYWCFNVVLKNDFLTPMWLENIVTHVQKVAEDGLELTVTALMSGQRNRKYHFSRYSYHT